MLLYNTEDAWDPDEEFINSSDTVTLARINIKIR
jgi:hypothetical protein